MKPILRKANVVGRSGFTLMEVMVATLLLAILSVGGFGFMARSNEGVARQRERRASVEAANRRMERARAQAYKWMDQVGEDWVWLEFDGAGFALADSNPDETVYVNGLQRSIKTRARLVETAAGDYTTATCLELDVQVGVGAADADHVRLRSLYAGR